MLPQGDSITSVWGNRCITAAQLGLQVFNHPGTPLQANLVPPAYSIPQLGKVVLCTTG